MEWKEYIDNHSEILKSNQKVDNSEIIINNFSEIERTKKRGNFILRQDLKNLTIFCSLKVSVIFNLIFFMLFIILGIYIVLSSKNMTEKSINYNKWYF